MKYWSECSKEEKAEVNAIDNKRKLLKQQFQDGEITGRKYRYNLTLLDKKLYEVKKKYD